MTDIRTPKHGDKLMIALKSGGEVPAEYLGYGESLGEKAIYVNADNMHFAQPAIILVSNIAAFQFLDNEDWTRATKPNEFIRNEWRKKVDALSYESKAGIVTVPSLESIEGAVRYSNKPN